MKDEDVHDESKLRELVNQAKHFLDSSRNDRMSLWRAYTSIEYAILDLKLRWGTDEMLSTGNGIGLSKSKIRGKRKEQEQQMNSVDLVNSVRTKLEKLNLDSEKQLLLQELRSCRDILKMLVKSY